MQNTIAFKLAQIPAGVLLVGIDPHQQVHAVVVMTQQAQVLTKFKVPVNQRGFAGLEERVRALVSAVGAPGAMWAIEAGSHHWRTLAYHLESHGQQLRLVNPFTLKRNRDGDDLNKRKTDYRDAQMAAELLRTGKFTETTLVQGVYAELRAAHQGYQRAQMATTRVKNLLKALLDGHFPEFRQVFREVLGRTALAVLETGLAPREIAALEAGAWVRELRCGPTGKYLRVKKLLRVHELAATSLGVPAGAAGVCKEIGLLVARARQLVAELTAWEERMAELLPQVPEYVWLRGIPGLGTISLAGVLAETGPLPRFRRGKQLIKLAGTNPTGAESAGKVRERTPMSKKGRAGLRRVLWTAGMSLLRHNEDFRRWGKALRERPVHPLQAREVVGAAGNRLLRILFALVKKGETYHMPKQMEVAAAA